MNFNWKLCFKLCFSVFLLYLCISYWDSVSVAILGASAPIIIGFVIAYLVNIIMTFYQRHYFPKSKNKFVKKTRLPVCMLGAFLTVLAVIALVIGLVVPELVSCIQVIIEKLPTAIGNSITRLSEVEFISDELIASLREINWQQRITDILGFATTGVGSVVSMVISSVTAVFSGVVTGFLSLIFAIYFLIGKVRLIGQVKKVCKHYLKDGIYKKISYTVKVINDSFHRYIVGQCIEAVILGVLCTVGMLILKLPYATMIGALIAFTALIPIVGAFIGAAVGAFMILTEAPIKALIFIIYIVVLQQLEGNLIYPKVVGSSIGLPAIWVLAAVTVGGGVFGIPGMLIFVPLTAAIFKIIKDDIGKKAHTDVPQG
ncbi:MAG: AI-2E family transporter [Acutalibacteraceae bacterium]|nr:AI-2E family transporter [Acutalibacteraceae bacterium]